MFKNLSEKMREILKNELYRRYDTINKKLQEPFAKMHYNPYELEQMKEELRRIDEMIIAIKED